MLVLIFENVFVISAPTFYCFASRMDYTFLMLYLILTFILTSDWFLYNSIPQRMQFYYKNWKILSFIVFAICFIELMIQCIICYKYEGYKHFFRVYVIIVVYLLNFSIVTFLNFFKNRFLKNSRSSYVLTISNIIIYSFALPGFFFLVGKLLQRHIFISMIIFYLEIIPVALAIGHPVLVVYFLGKRNKNYKMAYNKLLRRTIQDYEQEDLDQQSVSDKYSNVGEGDKNDNLV